MRTFYTCARAFSTYDYAFKPEREEKFCKIHLETAVFLLWLRKLLARLSLAAEKLIDKADDRDHERDDQQRMGVVDSEITVQILAEVGDRCASVARKGIAFEVAELNCHKIKRSGHDLGAVVGGGGHDEDIAPFDGAETNQQRKGDDDIFAPVFR